MTPKTNQKLWTFICFHRKWCPIIPVFLQMLDAFDYWLNSKWNQVVRNFGLTNLKIYFCDLWQTNESNKIWNFGYGFKVGKNKMYNMKTQSVSWPQSLQSTVLNLQKITQQLHSWILQLVVTQLKLSQMGGVRL